MPSVKELREEREERESAIRILLGKLPLLSNDQKDIAKAARWISSRGNLKELMQEAQAEALRLPTDPVKARDSLIKLRKSILQVRMRTEPMAARLVEELSELGVTREAFPQFQAFLKALETAVTNLAASQEIPKGVAGRSKPGPKPDAYANRMANIAAVQFHKLTGKTPRVLWDRKPNRDRKNIPTGPYYNLVCALFQLYKIKGVPLSFAEAAEKRFRERQGQIRT